jgi:hypothetical protein
LAQLGRIYRLSPADRTGVSCDGDGLFGETALLDRSRGQGRSGEWIARPVAELNGELSQCYGLPLDNATPPLRRTKTFLKW